MVHIHNGIAIRNDKIMQIAATLIDPQVMLSEISQKKKDKYRKISLVCGI